VFGTASEYIITVPIQDRPPEFVTFDGNKTVNGNAIMSLEDVSFRDPGQDIVTASINWGDGTTAPGLVTPTNTDPIPTTGTVTGSHAFAYRPDPYTVTVTIQDRAGLTATQTFLVTVLDPTITLDAGQDQTIDEGGLVTLDTAEFNDPAALVASYTATVDWGDGTAHTIALVGAPATPADLGRLFGSHYYGQDGVYTATVSVTKNNQDPVSDTFLVTVNNVLPTLQVSPSILTGPGVPTPSAPPGHRTAARPAWIPPSAGHPAW
jgi:hypothetical protein